MVLLLVQRLSEGVVHPHKKLHDAFHTQFYGNVSQMFFLTGKVASFEENCVLKNFLGVT